MFWTYFCWLNLQCYGISFLALIFDLPQLQVVEAWEHRRLLPDAYFLLIVLAGSTYFPLEQVALVLPTSASLRTQNSGRNMELPVSSSPSSVDFEGE
jgi:hypothetical protein